MLHNSYRVSTLFILHQSANVFTYDVELKVDHRAYLDIVEIGILKSVRDNGHLEGVISGVAHCEAHTIHRNRALINGKVATLSHRLIESIFECEIVAAIGIINGYASGGLVNMTLHDVAIQTTVHHHATLNIHLITHLEQAQVGTVESFFHRRYHVCISCFLHYRKTHAVVRYALVNTQLIYK